MDMGKLISTVEAAESLGVTVPRVHQFIQDGRLPAQRIGRTFVIDKDDLKRIVYKQPGRPPGKVAKKSKKR